MLEVQRFYWYVLALVFFFYLDDKYENKNFCLRILLAEGSINGGFVFVVLPGCFLSLPGQSVDITSFGFWNLDQYGRIEFSHKSAYKDPRGCVWSCFP